MLTIFACPKPFTDQHTATIQLNAITSWTLLRPKPEIILFGDEPGIAEICRKLCLRHVQEISTTAKGTPLLGDFFGKAQALSQQPLLCYINSDIILMQDFITSVEVLKSQKQSWVMIGARTDVDLRDPVDFENANWTNGLKALVRECGVMMGTGTDYVVFPSGLYDSVPEFAMGRPGYDNWLVWFALQKGVSLVDATADVLAVHQSHRSTGDWAETVKSVEARRNYQLAGWWPLTYTPADATCRLSGGQIFGSRGRHYRYRLLVLRQLVRGYLTRQRWVRKALGKHPLEPCG